MRNLIVLFFLVLSLSMAQAKKTMVLIAYHSLTGNTKAMAEAVAEGAATVPQVEARLINIKKVKRKDILSADAIIVGSPVHNANITPAVQRFINNWPFKNSPLKNKLGAAFVSAGGISAGEELAQMNILHSMLIYNMIVIGGADWKSAFGASAIVEEMPFKRRDGEKDLQKQFILKARALGERVARISQMLSE